MTKPTDDDAAAARIRRDLNAPESAHGSEHDAEADYVRRRRLRFRSWHRGTKEADLLLGSFADAHLDSFDEAQLNAFEDLLMENDGDIYDWVSGRKAIPTTFATPVMELLQSHRVADWLTDTRGDPAVDDTTGGGQ